MHALLHSVPPTLQQATADPCLHQRLLDTHRQVLVSLFWGHCSFLLGHGAHKFFVCVPSKSLFLQSCVSSGRYIVGLMLTSSKRAYATPICCIQSPCPCSSPLLTRTSAGDTQTPFCLSLCRGSLGPGMHKVCFSPLSISSRYGV